MHFATLTKTVLAGIALHAGTATAIFECNADQHAFEPTKDKFVVHYTSIRDSNYDDGQPWVRICKPKGDLSGWNNVGPLKTPCKSDPATHLSTKQTGLRNELIVTNGEGCDSGSGHGLNGASMVYNDQVAVLEGSNGRCGPRDHGVTCEFNL
ncbi:hypothetical protein CGCF415_v011024 [Colletotrichum fructicola]|uniref:Uncharacterized protein n=1 Tax=Colletotrichum fructicola (strain Nara gc5) TaxID=1213859 RepID=L2FV44_COLFN|nr:uncharacterized protein CGMCC3_g11836 [Colletotrichum fructicola]KAF4480646.1 hypothetical protein CGGC5_v010434 [Colletotrichum fructicola Nara gc5]KAI8290966.1 hypothetical protein K4K60_003796 [Colletotrichum sp. SAR11_57]KAE9572127.1 hypothetical protein CGMCC3_g11836 [Colletotrichum fructicola]KAF4432451.1 hypothetical protein CFRS1_v013650 [Colletotrichum fructicola]KAF4897120.1 hypothetical protein CGCFRS4_v005084 [Colletotrichum fructicola]